MLCQLFRKSGEETQLWDVGGAGVGSSRVPKRDRSGAAVPKPGSTFGVAAPLTLETLRLLSEFPQTLEQRLGDEGGGRSDLSLLSKSTHSMRSHKAPGHLWSQEFPHLAGVSVLGTQGTSPSSAF